MNPFDPNYKSQLAQRMRDDPNKHRYKRVTPSQKSRSAMDVLITPKPKKAAGGR